MKNIILTLLFAMSAHLVIAQENKLEKAEASNPHRIVFQLSTNDTLAHKALMKQIKNITSVAPDTKIEVVCHGPGLEILVIGKTTVQEKIALFTDKGIDFLACEFSMSERNVSKEKIIPQAKYVKAGIIEIVSKQEQGWSYIKSGF